MLVAMLHESLPWLVKSLANVFMPLQSFLELFSRKILAQFRYALDVYTKVREVLLS